MTIKWLENKIYEGKLKKMGSDDEKAEGIRSKTGARSYFLLIPEQDLKVPLQILWNVSRNLSKPCFLLPSWTYFFSSSSSLSPPFFIPGLFLPTQAFC